jgi:hypothetical protein
MVISDRESEFIHAFEKEWINWQGDALADLGHDDALDAVFGVFHLGLNYLYMGRKQDSSYLTNPLFPRKEKQQNPWATIGRHE